MIKTVKLGLILMVFCVISAGLLAYVYIITQPRIVRNSSAAYDLSVKEVLPVASSGEAVRVAPRGYGGPVVLLVGVSNEKKVVGIKVLSQKETPGLGAKVVERGFLDQFIGKGANDPLEPKKDIDAITGATITSRAVCEGVRQAIRGKK
ncbi:MAG: FMN-binding protein [Candidatus Margulisiibacteriota bacterium]